MPFMLVLFSIHNFLSISFYFVSIDDYFYKRFYQEVLKEEDSCAGFTIVCLVFLAETYLLNAPDTANTLI